MKQTFLLIPLLLITLACPTSSVEQNARDVSASLGGLLTTAQAQHQECKQDATPAVCTTINKGIAGQNALITSLQSYCGWATATPPSDTTAACVPVKDAEGALKAAISNANQLVGEIKGTIK